MAKPIKKSAVIEPLIRANGDKHALEALFDGDPGDLPELKSIGYANLGGANKWVSYVITTKGTEVVSVEVAEPDMRAIAEESSKINFVNCFVDQGAF